MHDYTYVKEAPEAEHFAELNKLVKELTEAEEAVKKAESELKRAKEAWDDVATHRLPAKMDELGLASFTPSDGGKPIRIKEIIRASIPKHNQLEAFAWLEANGFEYLIKHELTTALGKGEAETAAKVRDALRKLRVPLKEKRGVHASTLSAFAKQMLDEGEFIPQDLLGVFRQRVAKVG